MLSTTLHHWQDLWLVGPSGEVSLTCALPRTAQNGLHKAGLLPAWVLAACFGRPGWPDSNAACTDSSGLRWNPTALCPAIAMFTTNGMLITRPLLGSGELIGSSCMVLTSLHGSPTWVWAKVWCRICSSCVVWMAKLGAELTPACYACRATSVAILRHNGQGYAVSSAASHTSDFTKPGFPFSFPFPGPYWAGWTEQFWLTCPIFPQRKHFNFLRSTVHDSFSCFLLPNLVHRPWRESTPHSLS